MAARPTVAPKRSPATGTEDASTTARELLDLSIVVPVHDEEDNVGPLYEALTTALRELGRTYEIIVVDDGSRDDTYQRLLPFAQADESFKLIKLRRNFGQTAAMAAGFDRAVGQIVIPMDGDLQNDPTDIPRLLAKLDEGYDLVTGYRENRQDNSVTRKLPSWMANQIIRRLTGVPVRDNGCTL